MSENERKISSRAAGPRHDASRPGLRLSHPPEHFELDCLHAHVLLRDAEFQDQTRRTTHSRCARSPVNGVSLLPLLPCVALDEAAGGGWCAQQHTGAKYLAGGVMEGNVLRQASWSSMTPMAARS